ncbi:GAF domain-containing protein [Streptomyces sp. WAC07149]|uniref:SpoIIE family protein phosphatase n=1 Tax=Streptomyces sp. WAC07149 TaxID=2487425 RepID=UPI000F77874F|nr:SpoIIE family protein phosphatase [Streptomyces sp. WAC07149]RST06942.1 GAF domain-containing protein [Streptomyces sp. WAC07149]
MDRFARLAARLLSAPHGLVWLEPDGEAAEAVSENWPAGSEPGPAVLECCRRVAETARPRFVPRTGHGAAAFAFAGVPLAGTSGELVGVLAVVDRRPREWSADDVRDLSDLAAACSAQMRMRSRSESGRQAREAAEDAAQAAEGEATRAQELLSRSELLLRAAEDLADTSSLDDVHQRVADLVSGDLKPVRMDLLLVREGMLHPLNGPPGAGSVPLDSHWPAVRALREDRMIVVAGPSRAAGAAPGPPAAPGFAGADLRTAVCLPLRGTRDTLGVLVLGWDTRYEIGVEERAVLATLAVYTAQAVERALHLDERVTVARRLQQAMLTDLPATPGLELAALYRPAALEDMVGGDWYDAYPLPEVPGTGGTGALALTVGDITGHDMGAAAIMGQVRSMLRQADQDHPGGGPHEALAALERACRRLDLPAGGTVVHAHLHPAAAGHWLLRWSNAGHPAPLLAGPDRTVGRLEEHDVLLHPALPPRPRTSHSRLLTPGSTLLLYTDGLVEERGKDIDARIDRLARHLADAPPGIPLNALLRSLLRTTGASDARDDAVLLAVRVPARPMDCPPGSG